MFVEEMLVQINNMGLLLSVGFLVGLAHAFEPDHMFAMMTQVRGSKKDASVPPARITISALRNSLPGAFWGFGHTSMILFVSFLVFVLALNIPAMVFDGFEFLVGMMLVVLGISMYGKRIFPIRHLHPHEHNGIVHTHQYEHGSDHSHTHKSYIIGCLHGLAGSGSLIAISVVALDDISNVLSFVLIFGIGSVIGMMIVSGVLSVPFLLSSRFARLRKSLHIVAGTVTVIIGLEVIHGVITTELIFV